MLVRGRLWVAFGLSVMLLAASVAGASAATDPYTAGSNGYDVSYPNCGGSLPGPGTFGIVGATGGRAFEANPCLGTELDWAPAPPSLYMNLNDPIGRTASNGNTGPAGSCGRKDRACIAYNYGYNAAAYAADLVPAGTGVAAWWLDIETANSWSTTTSLNDRVIQGAIDYFTTRGLTVGIYSTAGQWTKIAGSYAPGLPNWVAGATGATASAFCGTSHAFGGGAVWLVQYPSNGVDGDYAC